jgi:hypothetical protein
MVGYFRQRYAMKFAFLLEGEVREETRLTHIVVTSADFSVKSGSRSTGAKHDGWVDGRHEG